MRPLILGDAAYPLCIYQLNPYLETVNLSESKKKKKSTEMIDLDVQLLIGLLVFSNQGCTDILKIY